MTDSFDAAWAKAIAENEQLRREIRRGENTYHEGFAAGFSKSEVEIERLTTERDRWQHDALGWSDRLTAAEAEIQRLRLTPEEAYLQIVEGWLRENRGIHFPEGAVDDLCQRIARRA